MQIKSLRITAIRLERMAGRSRSAQRGRHGEVAPQLSQLVH